MSSYAGQHIWIIGCSTGIGNALARELSEQGATLILSARSLDKLDALNQELGGKHLVCAFDTSDVEAMRDAATMMMSRYPKLDRALFLAAMYSPHDGNRKELGFIHKMVDVNLNGAFNMIDVVQPIFEEQGRGQIVLCGSVAGYRGLPTGQPYCATKAAIISLAETLKIDLEPLNIDVKLICPGFVKTPLTDKNDFPMPMMIEAEDAARAIAKGMCARGFEIHFPKKFTFIMKFLRLLPNSLYFMISRRLNP